MMALGLRALIHATGGRWLSGPLPVGEVTGISIDSRAVSPGDLFVALRGERADGHAFVGEAGQRGALASLIAAGRACEVRAGSRGGLIAVADPLDALERLALWYRRRLGFEVTAVTGSVGKTTTKEFLRAVLAKRFDVGAAPKSYNNRLGVALTLLSAEPAAEQLIVEMGASAPGELSYLSGIVRPERVVVTAVAPAHLSGLGDLDGVIAAKSEILDGVDAGGRAYFNASMPGLDRFLARAPCAARTFGRPPADFALDSCRALAGGGGWEFAVNGHDYVLPVPGRHNVMNALAAVAVASDLGLEPSEVRSGLLGCRLPAGRLDVSLHREVLFIDDAYNANPCSMESAVRTLEELAETRKAGRRFAVLGDMLELGAASAAFHEGIGRALAESRRPVEVLVTVGEESERISTAFIGALGSGRLQGVAEAMHFREAREARRYLEETIRPGDTVLFKGSNRTGLCRLAQELKGSVAREGEGEATACSSGSNP